MSEYVLDASALLAIWFREPGADRVLSIARRSIVGAVNLSEALSKYVSKRGALQEALIDLEDLSVPIIAFDQQLAIDAAALKARHPNSNLSFADRACLALAMREGATALTSDKEWSSLTGVGSVEQLR